MKYIILSPEFEHTRFGDLANRECWKERLNYIAMLGILNPGTFDLLTSLSSEGKAKSEDREVAQKVVQCLRTAGYESTMWTEGQYEDFFQTKRQYEIIFNDGRVEYETYTRKEMLDLDSQNLVRDYQEI